MLAGCFFFTVSFDSCNLGISYDKKHKLYKEIDFSGCTMSEVYGKRWERLGFVTFSAGTVLLVAGVIGWRRKRERENKSILQLVQEE